MRLLQRLFKNYKIEDIERLKRGELTAKEKIISYTVIFAIILLIAYIIF